MGLSEVKADTKARLKQAIYGLGKAFPIRPGTYSDCASICCALHQCGIQTTAGKFSPVGDNPAGIVREYQRISDLLSHDESRRSFYLSVKPPALLFDIEQVSCMASTAFNNNQAIHFDSHTHMDAEPTIQLLAQLIERFGFEQNGESAWRYGLSLPSRWKRSLEDARWAIDHHVMPRLIKGEFKARSASEEMDPHEGYLTLVDQFAGTVPEIILATHDYGLAKEAIARIKKTNTRVEMELLFGMSCTRMMSLSRRESIPLRFYIPYGDTLLIYGIHHYLTHLHKIFRSGPWELFSSCESKLKRVINAA